MAPADEDPPPRLVEARYTATLTDAPALRGTAQLKVLHSGAGAALFGFSKMYGQVAGGQALILYPLRGPHATLLAVGWTGELPELPVPVRHVTEAAAMYDDFMLTGETKRMTDANGSVTLHLPLTAMTMGSGNRYLHDIFLWLRLAIPKLPRAVSLRWRLQHPRRSICE